jgi:hypothetical protein
MQGNATDFFKYVSKPVPRQVEDQPAANEADDSIKEETNEDAVDAPQAPTPRVPSAPLPS